MLDVGMREFLAFMLRLPDGHARRLLRLQYVQEASIFVIPDLEEWVAVEEDVHAASVLRDALKALMSGARPGAGCERGHVRSLRRTVGYRRSIRRVADLPEPRRTAAAAHVSADEPSGCGWQRPVCELPPAGWLRIFGATSRDTGDEHQAVADAGGLPDAERVGRPAPRLVVPIVGMGDRPLRRPQHFQPCQARQGARLLGGRPACRCRPGLRPDPPEHLVRYCGGCGG